MFLRFTSFKPCCSWYVLNFSTFQALRSYKLCSYKKNNVYSLALNCRGCDNDMHEKLRKCYWKVFNTPSHDENVFGAYQMIEFVEKMHILSDCLNVPVAPGISCNSHTPSKNILSSTLHNLWSRKSWSLIGFP